MLNNLKKVWNILQIVIIVYVVLITLFIMNKNSFGYTEIGSNTYVNVTKENKKFVKNINNGDFLIINRRKDIKENDSLYYYTVKDNYYVVRETKVIEKSDNGYVTSEMFVIDNSKIIGNKMYKIKFIGYYFNFIYTKFGFFLLILFPIIIVFIYKVIDFVLSMREINNIRIESVKNDLFEDTYRFDSNVVKKINDEFNKSVDDVKDEIKRDFESIDFNELKDNYNKNKNKNNDKDRDRDAKFNRNKKENKQVRIDEDSIELLDL